jgi:uncharacterized protein YkwD
MKRLIAIVSALVLLSLSACDIRENPNCRTTQPDGQSRTWSQCAEEEIDEMITFINTERRGAGLTELSRNGALGYTARQHSKDLACNNLFGHEGSEGQSFEQRIDDMGRTYAGRPAAENIYAATNLDTRGAFNGWMGSTYGHRENILDTRWNELGVSCVRVNPHNVYVDDEGESFDFAYYWTAIFIDR